MRKQCFVAIYNRILRTDKKGQEYYELIATHHNKGRDKNFYDQRRRSQQWPDMTDAAFAITPKSTEAQSEEQTPEIMAEFASIPTDLKA
ncbi:MAG TPA: hypothetical protein VIY48_01090 [Candidatus Paceibacterota bacterium]